MIRVRRIGVALAGRRVPFAEVVASMHLFRGERNRLLSRRRRSALSRLRKGKPLPDKSLSPKRISEPDRLGVHLWPFGRDPARRPAGRAHGRSGNSALAAAITPIAAANPATLSFIDTERDLIQRALGSTGGNKFQAAKLLGISRKRLYARLRRYQLD